MKQLICGAPPHPELVQQQLHRVITELQTQDITAKLDRPVQYGQELILVKEVDGQVHRGRLVLYYGKGGGLSSVTLQGVRNALMQEAKDFLEALLLRLTRTDKLVPIFSPLW